MSHSSDVKAKNFTTDSAMSVGRARIRGVQVLVGAGTGVVTIKDGGASGTAILTLKFYQNSDSTVHIPGDGLLSVDDPYIDLTNISSITVFYA